VNTPVLCQVRKRLTKHGGETMNAPEAWLSHFQQHRQQARQLEKAAPARNGKKLKPSVV
jgi:hypothetical protein